jgi:cellulose synthase/poly-beta-1,6-N-acetylglucosamine synthase-like glycosyltransferase
MIVAIDVVLSWCAGALAAWLLLPSLSDLISLARRKPRRQKSNAEEMSKFIFLVPAHNEARMLPECLSSLKSMRYPRDAHRIVVVADNCTDMTAQIARGSGVTCFERNEPMLPGKPHAIAWVLDRLHTGDFDALVIVDADIAVHPLFAMELHRAGPLSHRVVQPYNDVRNREESSLTRMASVYGAGLFRGAFALKERAGLAIPLSAGMCVGSAVLERHGWPALSLSEDWEMYARLTAAGTPIHLAPDARHFAQEASGLHQSASQRRRWSAGRLGVLWSVGPSIIRSRSISWPQKLDAIAELGAFGPAMTAAVVASVVAALFALSAPSAAKLTIALLASQVRSAAYAIVGLLQDPNPWRAAAAFAALPFYACWRLVLGLSLLWPARRTWVRTAR